MIDPIEMKEYDGSYFLGWSAKGHHDPGRFCQRVREEFGDDPRIRPGNVRHLYHRCTPSRQGISLVYPADGPGPGAFPVTVIKAQ